MKKQLFVLILLAVTVCGCSLDPVIYPGTVSGLTGTWTIQQKTVKYTYADGHTYETGAGIDGGLVELTFSGENRSSLGLSIGGPKTEMTYAITTQNGKRFISFTPKFDEFEPYEITTQSATLMQWEASKTGDLDDGIGGRAVSAVSSVVLSKL